MEAAWDWSLKRPVRGWDGVRVSKWGVMARHPPPTPLEFGILGAVAQLGERCVRNAEVEGSTPFRSTCFVLAQCRVLLAADLGGVALDHELRPSGIAMGLGRRLSGCSALSFSDLNRFPRSVYLPRSRSNSRCRRSKNVSRAILGG
jgi:hypothetical protein